VPVPNGKRGEPSLCLFGDHISLLSARIERQLGMNADRARFKSSEKSLELGLQNLCPVRFLNGR